MYGENGAQMRTELAALLRQHRVMHRLAADSPTERAEVGQQILRFRQTLVIWCAQAIGVTRPLTFPNIPQKPADPFRATSEHGAALGELARALELARDQATTHDRVEHGDRDSELERRSSNTGAWRHARRHSPSTTPRPTRPCI